MNADEISALKTRLEAGDRATYKSLMVQTGDYCIKRLMAQRSCTYEDAEDLYMDALLDFRDQLLEGKITHLTQLRSYLFAICRNKWSEKHRKEKRERQVHAHTAADWYAPEKSREATWVEEEMTAEAEQQRKVYQRISQGALRALSDRCQAILTYFYVEEKSMADIAHLMGYANAQTVKNLKARCYKRWITRAHEQSE